MGTKTVWLIRAYFLNRAREVDLTSRNADQSTNIFLSLKQCSSILPFAFAKLRVGELKTITLQKQHVSIDIWLPLLGINIIVSFVVFK